MKNKKPAKPEQKKAPAIYASLIQKMTKDGKIVFITPNLFPRH